MLAVLAVLIIHEAPARGSADVPETRPQARTSSSHDNRSAPHAGSREPREDPQALTSANAGRPVGTKSPKTNLLLITLDTTRADRLGCYGYAKAQTPNLDALAREGARADQAVTVAPLTLPAHSSILTSLYPPRHGVRDNADFKLPSIELTLAEHLKSQGYGTAAVVGSIVLDGRLGLAQGFDTYDEPRRRSAARAGSGTGVLYESMLERPAAQVTDSALAALDRLIGARSGPSGQTGSQGPGKQGRRETTSGDGSTPAGNQWNPDDERAVVDPGRGTRGSPSSGEPLERAGKPGGGPSSGGRQPSAEPPFFLWVHYYDPHADYTPPAPYSVRFAGRLYDGEIAYMDAEIGRLLNGLRGRRLLDRTLVVALADHGESLGEHGEASHGLLLYEATLRVPLIARLPGVVPPSIRISRPVSGVDIAPTALDLMSLPAMPGAQGRSFAEEIHRHEASLPAPDMPLYSESLLPERAYGWSPLFALRRGPIKFIAAPEPELYDLQNDPAELHNLAAGRPEEIEAWKTTLASLMGGFGSSGGSASRPMDAEERERLESLGYVSGRPESLEGREQQASSPEKTRTETGSPGTTRQGPGRDATHQGPGSPSERAGSAGSSAGASRPDPKHLVAVHQAIVEAKELVAARRIQEARARLVSVLIQDPANPTALSLAGTLDFSMGAREGGLERLGAAALAAPAVYENQRNLANALHVVGRLEEAARAYRAALTIRPDSAADHYALGNVLFARRETTAAIAEYREAIRLGDGTAGLHAALGVALASSDDTEGAETALRKAVEIDGTLSAAWSALGSVSERKGRWDAACRSYGRAVAAGAGTAEIRLHNAFSCRQAGMRDRAERSARDFLAKYPGHPGAPYLRASLSLDAGDRLAARRSFEEFLAQPTIDPQLAREARAQLATLKK